MRDERVSSLRPSVFSFDPFILGQGRFILVERPLWL